MVGDAGLSPHDLPVTEACGQSKVGRCRGQNASSYCQDAAGLNQGLVEAFGHVGHRDYEEVPEAVTLEAATLIESILEQVCQQRLVF